MEYFFDGSGVDLDAITDEELAELQRSVKVRLETVSREMRYITTERCYRNLVPEARRPTRHS